MARITLISCKKFSTVVGSDKSVSITKHYNNDVIFNGHLPCVRWTRGNDDAVSQATSADSSLKSFPNFLLTQ